jgi:hypothetical protein
MDNATLNLIIGGSIAIISSIVTSLIGNIFQISRDRRLAKFDVSKKIIDSKLVNFIEMEKKIIEDFRFYTQHSSVIIYSTRPREINQLSKFGASYIELGNLQNTLKGDASLISSGEVVWKITGISDYIEIFLLAAKKELPDIDSENEKRVQELININNEITDQFYTVLDILRDKRENLVYEMIES